MHFPSRDSCDRTELDRRCVSAPLRACGRVEQALEGIVDAALSIIILLAPYFMGGRHPAGGLVYVLLAVIMALAWFARLCISRHKPWTHSSAEWVLLAGALLLLVQLTPLPASVIAVLSPKLGDTLPLWTADAAHGVQLGVWNQVSLVPEATRGALALFLAYALLFVVLVQRLRAVADVERVLKLIALSAVAMAICGLLQFIFSNGKFLWMYQHPFRDTNTYVQGTFHNHNHFAHMLALGVGPLAFWSVTRRYTQRVSPARAMPWSRHRRDLCGTYSFWLPIALGIVIFAGLLSLSRGGAIALLVSVTVCGTIYYRGSLLRGSDALTMLAVASLVLVALLIHGYERVAGRLDDLASGSLDQLDSGRGRRGIWEANLAAIIDYPILGTGVGSHREVHPMYRPDSPHVEFTHAENGYLQVASEAGMAGVLVMCIGIAQCGIWCFGALRRCATKRTLAALGAVSAGLTASAVHSLVDFVWYIPACMALTVILAACAYRLWDSTWHDEHPSSTENNLSTACVSATAPCLLVVCAWMVATQLRPALASPDWDKYLRASVAAGQLRREQLKQLAYGAGAPVDPSADRKVASLSAAMITRLERVLSWHPRDARAELRLASLCLERFDALQRTSDNAMELSQIRDAAIQSQFRSQSELDAWLARAIGARTELLHTAMSHALRGLRLCPLQGEGYLHLAELCFLQGGRADAKAALLNQALRVRPKDGNVLFTAGKEAALAGNLAGAVSHWKECFHCGNADQQERILLLAGQLPVSFVLNHLHPTLRDLQRLYVYYKARERTQDLNELCAWYLRLAEAETRESEGERAVEAWLFAWQLCRELNRPQQARRCAETAHQLDANNYQVRHALALSLLDQGTPADAEEHLRWCLARKPDDHGLRSLLETVVRERVVRRNRDLLE